MGSRLAQVSSALDFRYVISSFKMALKRKPLDQNPEFLRALALHRGGQLNEAEALYQQLLQRYPRHPQIIANLGVLALQKGQLDQCIQLLEQSLAIQPNQPEALSNLANAIQYRGDLQEAVALYERALLLRPSFSEAWSNRGKALVELGRPQESLESCEKAIAFNPGFADAYGNRGNALKELGRLEQALQSYDQALVLNPHSAEPHFNKALVQLMLGQFESGWRLYEWRWACAIYAARKRHFEQPQWLGEPVRDKTVLLYAEQGFGDTIQFCRYVIQLKGLGAEVVLEVPAPLMALMQSLPAAVTLIQSGDDLPPFDFQCPLMSLPLALGTTLESIPAYEAYLGVDEQRQGVWCDRLGNSAGLRVGLAWSGSTEHVNDMNRSMPMDALVEVFTAPAEFHSLQANYRQGDRERLERYGMHDHADQLSDFAETAALISLLDLVVTVDTAVAHLAASLGKPVWLMLPFIPDYRWLMNREDSPWYPTMRLFRQERLHDWSGVVGRIANGLVAWARES